jgi:hypothetical protein
MNEELDPTLGQMNSLQPAAVRQGGETASTALAAQAKALIEARYFMAITRPRDLDMVREKLVKECKRPGFAKTAIYFKPVGDGVSGLSIRFVEAALRCMTNVAPEVITAYDDPEKRILRVTVTDMEANLPYSKDVTVMKTVERKFLKKGETCIKTRINSKNQQIFILEATDDDILNKENALVSKCLRALGLRILPGDLQDECMALCRKINAEADAKDPQASKKAIFDSFATLGVSADQIKEFLGHKGDTLQPKELEELRGLYSAMKDGETTWREIIDAKKPPEETEGREMNKPEGRKGSGALKASLKAATKDEPKVAAARTQEAQPTPTPEAEDEVPL